MDVLIHMDTDAFSGPSCYNRRMELILPPVFSSLASPGLLSSIFTTFPNIYAFSPIFTYLAIPSEFKHDQASPSQHKTEPSWGPTFSLATPFPLASHCMAPDSCPLPSTPPRVWLPSHHPLHLFLPRSLMTSLVPNLADTLQSLPDACLH